MVIGKDVMHMKYDKMVAISKEKSRNKAEVAKREIHKMLDRKEKITVQTLVKNTGFSKAIFYRNPEVREVLDNAIRQEGACYNPKQVVIDKAMEDKIINLKIGNTKLKMTVEKLKNQNAELQEDNLKLRQEIEKLRKENIRLKQL